MGLSQTGNDYYTVYGDPRCDTKTGVVKYDELCNNFNLFAVSLAVPSLGVSRTSQELGPPTDPFENLLQEVLLKSDGLMAENESMLTWWPEMNIIHVKTASNPGDRYQYDDVVAVDEQDDDDNDFNTQPFTFTTEEQVTWAGTELRRFRQQQTIPVSLSITVLKSYRIGPFR